MLPRSITRDSGESLRIQWEAHDVPDKAASCGHGLPIEGTSLDDGRVVLAFVEGFAWTRGASQVTVRVRADPHPAWTTAHPAWTATALRDAAVALACELLQTRTLHAPRGRLRVVANG